MNVWLLAILIKLILHTPDWVNDGQTIVGLAHAQSAVLRCRLYRLKRFRARFGVIWGRNHATALRRLLLIAADVEVNPGPTAMVQCDQCFYRGKPYNVERHKRLVHKEGQTEPDPPPSKKPRNYADRDVGFVVRDLVNQASGIQETALENRFKSYDIPVGGKDPLLALENAEDQITRYVNEELEQQTGIKIQIVLQVGFFKPVHPDEDWVAFFRSKQHCYYRGDDLNISEGFPKIINSIEAFQRRGSGWVVESVLKLELHVAKCQPLRGSTFIRLPKDLSRKRAIINIENKDNKCFMWAVLAAKFPASSHPERVSKYKDHENELDFSGIEFPVHVGSISRFERLNGIGINVYTYEDENVEPNRISKFPNPIHLMLYEGHYSWIKDFNRMLFDQRGDQHRKYFCPRCLIPRGTRELLDAHLELCEQNEPTRITMPKDSILKFKNYHRTLRQPLVCYADFECLTQKLDPPDCEPDPDESYTTPYQKHIPCGYGMVLAKGCCGRVEFSEPEVECCKDAVKRFLNTLMTVVIDYHNERNKSMTGFDPQKHASNLCHVCNEEITQRKVRDHCHICGKYRGPAHNECNQILRLNNDIVVVFHNLRKYDGHLIMQELGQTAKIHGFEISVIARAMEDYITFSLIHKKEDDGKGGQKDFSYKIKFIDSFQFLTNSLDGLVKNMDKSDFHAMKKQFNVAQLQLMLRKGVYPYSYMDSWEKFDETFLPPKKEFFNDLSGDDVSDQDYEHAQRVWNEFDSVKNLGDYHNLYLTTDVLLLADVFEKFRASTLDQYGLDPCHYVTTPSLAWDACLKMTKVKLELLQDPEMYIFFEAGIRGGLVQIVYRYAKANNPYMKTFDILKAIFYIMYWDFKNLYGWAMKRKLPFGGFRWLMNLLLDWKNMNADGPKGYILEVDLVYPDALHDKHNDLPLAPESMEISEISPYCQHLKEVMNLTIPKCRKLVPNLFNKEKYIIDLRHLQLCMRLGIEIGTVYRAIEYDQRAWMESYITFNSNLRALATNAFERDRLKLMNNAVFGKTMESTRKRKNVELVTAPMRFEKLAASPRYKNSCKFTEDLVGVCSAKASTCLDKPIYCGFVVLELSKVLVYEFHYDFIVPKYGKRAQLLFGDTDSLAYCIQTDEIYKDMKREEHRFDFSNYPKDHPCYSETNQAVIGVMKDEVAGEIIEEFVGLRPKMYSIWGPNILTKRAKGVKKGVVKRDITHKDYVETLEKEKYMRHGMNTLRSEKHQIYSLTLNKKSLCAYDDKRWLISYKESRAHGHKMNKYD